MGIVLLLKPFFQCLRVVLFLQAGPVGVFLVGDLVIFRVGIQIFGADGRAVVGNRLFLAGAGHGYCEKRQKWTRRYLQDTAVSLKKGDFNKPSLFSFFKKKTAA